MEIILRCGINVHYNVLAACQELEYSTNFLRVNAAHLCDSWTAGSRTLARRHHRVGGLNELRRVGAVVNLRGVRLGHHRLVRTRHRGLPRDAIQGAVITESREMT